MRSKLIGLSTLFGILSSSALAQADGRWEVKQGPKQPLAVTFASAIPPNHKLQDGDLERSIRQFGNWQLGCDTVLSLRNRICFIEQSLNDPKDTGNFIRWRLSMSINNKPYLTVMFPKDTDKSNPLTMALKVSNFDINFRAQSSEWICPEQLAFCLINIPYEGDPVVWLENPSTLVTFLFKREKAEKSVQLTGSMIGFVAAIDATEPEEQKKNRQNNQTKTATKPK